MSAPAASPAEVAQDASVSVTVTATKDPYATSNKEYLVMTTINPPSGQNRTPTDICCVVDVSGSMGTEATMKNASGQVEGHGLSVLDIVKHAVKTIIHAMQPQDRLSVVTFSDNAKQIMDLTPMTNSAKTKAEADVEALHTEGSTNIWGGLHSGMELLRKGAQAGRLSALLLLTDGLPNISPPNGELAMFRRYKEEHPLTTTINTFGFGYDINSELLRDIALEGDGMYAFIPDSSFVGTAFVNATSNLLVLLSRTAQLSLEPMNGAKLAEDNCILGGLQCQKTSWGASVSLCALQYGQKKQVVARVTLPDNFEPGKPYLTATLKYQHRHSNSPVEVSAEGTVTNAADQVVPQRHRLVFVDTVRDAMKLMQASSQPEAVARIKALIEVIKGSTDKDMIALLEDLKGQVLEALAKQEYYQKWGRHYLPSLMRAHLLQQCNNFKDPGVQNYGGQLFSRIRDEIDEIFIKLPPPKPSITHSSYGAGASSAPVASMSTYYSSGNPCFHGESLVTMSDGARKTVQAVKKGDVVMTPSGKGIKVVCVVKTHCNGGMTKLVELPGGLLVTPYHPVRVESAWKFPCDLAPAKETACPAVYSFVLAAEHVMIINDVECVTLAHGFDGQVVGHPYFGTKRVLHDLMKMNGWLNGLVELRGGCTVRDPATGLVCGLVSEEFSCGA